MDDAGDIAPAAAMGMMIFFTNAAVRITYVLVTKKILVHFQQWRHKV
jgi:iron(III) transport system permease protein